MNLEYKGMPEAKTKDMQHYPLLSLLQKQSCGATVLILA